MSSLTLLHCSAAPAASLRGNAEPAGMNNGLGLERVVLEPACAKVNRSAEYSRTVDSFHANAASCSPVKDYYVSVVQACTVPLTCTYTA